MVEFALCAPLWLLWLIASIQVALVVMQYYSLMNVTRDTARWVAINQDTLDGAVLAHAQANPFTLTPSRIATTVTPSCTALVGGLCTGRSSGGTIKVTATYDVANWIFIPSQYQLGIFQASIPTTLPAYAVSVTIE